LLAPGIAAVFLLGVSSKKITSKAGITGLVTGFVLGMFRLGLRIFQESINPGSIIYKIFIAPNWLHYEIALFFLVIILMIVVSMFTPKPDPAAIRGLYFGSATPEEKAITRASWNKWDVIHTVIILSVIVAFYIYFW